MATVGEQLQTLRQLKELPRPATVDLSRKSIINEVLAWGEENNATAEETAIHFLQENPDVWKAWVPDETAEKIQSGL